MPIHDEARACAESSPVGMFGIDDIAIAIQVIEFGFKLWSACSQPSSAADAVRDVGVASEVTQNFRRARRRVARACRRQNLDLSTENLNGLTAHMLNHVKQADAESLNVCCSEPRIEDEIND